MRARNVEERPLLIGLHPYDWRRLEKLASKTPGKSLVDVIESRINQHETLRTNSDIMMAALDYSAAVEVELKECKRQLAIAKGRKLAKAKPKKAAK